MLRSNAASRPVRLWLTAVGMLAASAGAMAAGPRWVTGLPYFNTSGVPVIWYTDTPRYYTDPGGPERECESRRGGCPGGGGGDGVEYPDVAAGADARGRPG